MMFMMILFWVLIIVAVVLGIRWLLGQDKGSGADSALEILRQRYAHGEINKDDFKAKKKDLGGGKIGGKKYEFRTTFLVSL